MTLIEKSDLVFKDYFWHDYEKDNPHVTGVPDSILFNRTEGYEVLNFINHFCELFRIRKLETAVEIERLIREELPYTVKSQREVKIWLSSVLYAHRYSKSAQNQH